MTDIEQDDFRVQAATVSADEARRVAEAARESQWRKPSFGKGLFLGRLDLELIYPHPRADPTTIAAGEEFLDRLRRYLQAEVDGAVIEREAQIPDAVINGLRRLGVFGMKIPQSYGGLGLSQLYYNKALVLIGSAHASLAAMVSAHQSIGVPQPIKMFGTPAQKHAFLPRCAAGEISAFLLTEPDVGSDPPGSRPPRCRPPTGAPTSSTESSSGLPTVSLPTCSW